MPGRVRLRWQGAEPPPPAVLAEIEALPQVRDIEYRGDSRSIVVRYGADLPVLHASEAPSAPAPPPRSAGAFRASLREHAGLKRTASGGSAC